MNTTRIMRPVTYKRQGDLVYFQQPDPVTGKLQQIAVHTEQALILAQWTYDDLVDFDGGCGPEGEPMPESAPETATADGCTRTRPPHTTDAVRLVTGGRVDPPPARYIDGEFGRS